MPEQQPESKKNPIIQYFQDSYEELKKVTWPTRNQAIRLTFIVIGFCLVLSFIIGALDLVFNTGYVAIVNYSEKINPQTNVSATQVATGEPTSQVDLSKLKVNGSSVSIGSTQASGSQQSSNSTNSATSKKTGSTQQNK